MVQILSTKYFYSNNPCQIPVLVLSRGLNICNVWAKFSALDLLCALVTPFKHLPLLYKPQNISDRREVGLLSLTFCGAGHDGACHDGSGICLGCLDWLEDWEVLFLPCIVKRGRIPPLISKHAGTPSLKTRQRLPLYFVWWENSFSSSLIPAILQNCKQLWTGPPSSVRK